MTQFDISTIGSRFCLYLRKSREDILQEAVTNHDTLALHRQQLTEFAQRLRAPILKVYEEIGSAETIEGRPVFQELLEEVENGEWDGVFVIEIERLSRGSQREQGIVGEAFVDSGTFIFTLQKIYDPTNESDMEYFDFSLFMSRREYLTIRRRLLNGKLNHCRRGEFIGRIAPYGYDKVKIEGMKTLKPNEWAYVVKMIFDLYDQGDSMRTIAKKLTDKAIPTPNPKSKGGDNWSACSIKNILYNVVYTGKIRWMNRIYKIEKVNGKKRKKTVRNSNPHIFKGLHAPIIEQELYDRVQERLAGNISPFSLKWSRHNYYAGLIRCANCGAVLMYDSHRKNPYMLHRGWDGCDMKSCKLESLDNLVIAWLTATVEDLEFEINDDKMNTRLEVYQAERKRLEGEIAKAKKTMLENIERLEDGIYTKDQFLERQAVHNDRIERAETALANLEAPTLEASIKRASSLHETIEALRDPEFDVTAKNELLKSVISSISYVNRGKPGDDSQMILTIIPR